MARLLVVDDEPQMLAAYKTTFSTISDASPASAFEDSDLDALSEQLFGEPAKPKDSPHDFDVQYCSQGEEAARKVEEALASDQPFSVILLDMRMPPGIDGKETARRVRALDRDVNIVIVTGYSDHSPHTVAEVAGPIDKLFYITKPFDRVEIRQLAISLDARWRLEQELRRSQKTVAEKLELLEQAYVQLSINEAHARHASLHDPLTGLLNRTGFSQHVNQVLQSGQHVTVLFLDLDHFKNVNDTLGHQVGDILVRDVASAMSAVLPSPACIARLGGDEFGICLSTSRPELVEGRMRSAASGLFSGTRYLRASCSGVGFDRHRSIGCGGDGGGYRTAAQS
jgi:PleD family two-component response regulator